MHMQSLQSSVCAHAPKLCKGDHPIRAAAALLSLLQQTPMILDGCLLPESHYFGRLLAVSARSWDVLASGTGSSRSESGVGQKGSRGSRVCAGLALHQWLLQSYPFLTCEYKRVSFPGVCLSFWTGACGQSLDSNESRPMLQHGVMVWADPCLGLLLPCLSPSVPA